MKNIILLFTSALIYISGTAQYEQGDIDFSLGTGFGIYGGSTNNVDEVDTTGVDAACGLINVGVNYAIIDELSMGLSFERNSFVGQNNDSVSTDNYGLTNNFKFITEYRFVNSEKNALSFRAGLGLSLLDFGDHMVSTFVKGNGLNFELGLNYEHYFGEHVGLFINAAYANYNYKKLENENGVIWRTNNDTDNFNIKFSGVNTRIGLQIKI